MRHAGKIKVALMSYAMDGRVAKGSIISTHRLIERLVRDPNLDVTLVHFDTSDDPIYKEAREIIMPALPPVLNRRLFRMLYFFWKYRKGDFDIMHWFQPRLYPFFWLAPARHIVLTAHGAGDITAPGAFPLSRRMFNFVLTHFNHRISAIIAVSEFGREEIIQYYKASPERVIGMLHYNGGAEEYAPMERSVSQKIVVEKYNITAPYILDVSRLDPQKNVDTLIRAYISLRDRNPERRERLVIVGSPSYRYEETYALAENSQYKNDIQFVRYVAQEEMNALYSGAELVAFPSLNESFGMPVVEAMASGTPTITSNVTSLPEVAGGAPILVDPIDAEALAGAMQQVLSDTRLQQTLVAKGLERARPFTWDRGAEEVKALYRRVTGM